MSLEICNLHLDPCLSKIASLQFWVGRDRTVYTWAQHVLFKLQSPFINYSVVPSVKLIIALYPHPNSLLGFMQGMRAVCFIRCVIFVSGTIWAHTTTKRIAKVKHWEACLWFVLFVLEVTLKYTRNTWHNSVLSLIAPTSNLRKQTCKKILSYFAFLII